MQAENHNSSDQDLICRYDPIRSRNDDMSQSVWLFRKYLLAKSTQNNLGKANNTEAEFESEIIKKPSSPQCLKPPKNVLGGNNHRENRLSLLEKTLLPGLRCVDESNKASTTTEQLTIFYGGIINVYDNISADKALAIMRLAGENSSSVKPVKFDAERLIKQDWRKLPLGPKSQSVPKIRAGLPMARRYSLQCFLEKRRGRIINTCPYAIRSDKEKEEGKEASSSCMNHINGSNIEHVHDDDQNPNHKLSLSPFPSRLGYFSPKSAANQTSY